MNGREKSRDNGQSRNTAGYIPKTTKSSHYMGVEKKLNGDDSQI